MADLDFLPFQKRARLSREIIITEKIDGTSATVYIADDGAVAAPYFASISA